MSIRGGYFLSLFALLAFFCMTGCSDVSVYIVTPEPGAVFYEGDTVKLFGRVFEEKEGGVTIINPPGFRRGVPVYRELPADETDEVTSLGSWSLLWRSSLDGELSDTTMFTTNSLSVGKHRISFRADNQDPLDLSADTESILIEIKAGPPPPLEDGQAPVGVSGLCYLYFEGTVPDRTAGRIKIRNDLDEPLAYKMIVPGDNGVADTRYEFGGSGVTSTAPDGQTGDVCVEGFVQPHQDARIYAVLKEPITEDVEDRFNIEFQRIHADGSMTPIDDGTAILTGAYKDEALIEAQTAMLSALTGPVVADLVKEALMGLPAKKPKIHSKPSVGEKESEGKTDVIGTGNVRAAVSGGKALNGFPCGDGPNGFTICADFPAPAPGGQWLLLTMIVDDNIPLDDATNWYQYGFVFDADGVSTNNYVPDPEFPNDFFQNTDRWYSVEYNPAEGWGLSVVDARAAKVQAVFSAASATIRDNTILLAVPMSEFGSNNPAYRLTAFTHTGDFGLSGGDWNADYEPDVNEDLADLGVSDPIE
jgi:hypothetical protein